MQNITSTIELKNTILLLEKKKADQTLLLKKEFHFAFENLKPSNFIKNTLAELITSPDFKGNILNATMGLAAGYLSKKIMFGATHNPLKKILGVLLQMGVTKIVAKNSEGVKSTGLHFFKKIFSKK